MKKAILFFSILFLLAFKAAETSYIADTKESTIHWLGKKATGQHEGDVKLQRGKLKFNNSIPLSGEFVLDMNSITNTDIKDQESSADLVNHLKNDDFFGVKTFPFSTLTIKKFEKIETVVAPEPNYNATADLTIKGITNEIQFPARIKVNREGATASADITVDRTKWNIVYKSKSVLGSTADKFIYDDITFSVKLVLIKE